MQKGWKSPDFWLTLLGLAITVAEQAGHFLAPTVPYVGIPVLVLGIGYRRYMSYRKTKQNKEVANVTRI